MIFSDLLHAVCYCSHVMASGTNGSTTENKL